jgi:hypothetical protein
MAQLPPWDSRGGWSAACELPLAPCAWSVGHVVALEDRFFCLGGSSMPTEGAFLTSALA